MFKINETSNEKINDYADSIADYLVSNDLHFDVYDYDDFAEDLDNAIQNGEIVYIPELDKEDAFKLAIENLQSDNEEDDFDDSMDGDFDSGMKSAGWGTDEDYGSASDMYEDTIKDTNEVIRMLGESLASRKAKKLGLVHVGFGNYAEESGGPAEYKTVNGKLKKVKGGTPVKKVKKSTETPKETKKEETPKKEAPEPKGIRNLRRVSGEKYVYEFELNGRKYKFTLNKTERKKLSGKGSILGIVQDRLKQKETKQKSKHFKKGEHAETPKK